MELHVSFLQLAHKKQAGMARERDATLFVRAITGTATRAPTPPAILGFHFRYSFLNTDEIQHW
jgi:hypothetical protein